MKYLLVVVVFAVPFLPWIEAEDVVADIVCIDLVAGDSDARTRFLLSAEYSNVGVTSVNIVEDKNDDSSSTCSKEKCANSGDAIVLLRSELQQVVAKSEDTLVIVTRGVDQNVVFNADGKEILARYRALKADLLFSSDLFCWPDPALCSKYPDVSRGRRFLNSGVIMGRASKLLDLMKQDQVDFADDYQLFFSQLYVNEAVRNKYGMSIDHTSRLLQNVNGVSADLDLRYKGSEAYVQNTQFSTDPCIVFGNATSRVHINALGNYLAGAWSPVDGCGHCWKFQKELGKDPTKFPTIVMAIFIEAPTPFFEEFLQYISEMIYPKRKIHLFVHNTVKYHDKLLGVFMDRYHASYASIKIVTADDDISERQARQQAVQLSVEKDTDFYFSVDSTAHLDNPYTLKLLIEQNVDVLAPLLIRPYTNWANFWGSLSSQEQYAESADFSEIVDNKIRGLWNVPLISSCYLISKSVLQDTDFRPNFSLGQLNPNLAFAANLRTMGRFMYVTNRAQMGHLVSTDKFNTSRLFDELWQMEVNRWDWERRYLHVNYSMALRRDVNNDQPCPDVYWFPIVSERFCQELIDTMENFGQWSSGSNDDARLEGGYESVPTRDIHMKQVDFEEQWLSFLRDYVRPLQEKVYDGYFSDPLEALLNFVVRYRPDEQPFLRPHHDTSTYTINIALNTPGTDYQGGGCRFLRYDCSVTDSRRGWMLMHPGRLTHYHEGLPTTGGTRYIMISFIDP